MGPGEPHTAPAGEAPQLKQAGGSEGENEATGRMAQGPCFAGEGAREAAAPEVGHSKSHSDGREAEGGQVCDVAPSVRLTGRTLGGRSGKAAWGKAVAGPGWGRRPPRCVRGNRTSSARSLLAMPDESPDTSKRETQRQSAGGTQAGQAGLGLHHF